MQFFEGISQELTQKVIDPLNWLRSIVSKKEVILILESAMNPTCYLSAVLL